MPSLDRFAIVAQLPPLGEWRRTLAVDLSGAPRVVVLEFAPPSVLDDPERLAAILRDAEAAGRLNHPGVIAVFGTETVDDALAVVEQHLPGPTLRELLDAAGRLPADVAVRLSLDACAALEHAHSIDVGAGRKLAHGQIDPARIVVGEGGAPLVCGFGTSGGGDAAGDVRALATVLYECLAGEPPGELAQPIDLPGIPDELAGVVDRALGVGEGAPFPTAEAFARAVAAAGNVASHEAVAAYAEAIVPAGVGERAALRSAIARALRGHGGAEEVSAEPIVEPTDPAMKPASPGSADSFPLMRPPSTRPGVDPAGVFRAPAVAQRRSRVPFIVALCGVAGFVVGLAGSRLWLSAGGYEPPLGLEEALTPVPAGPGLVSEGAPAPVRTMPPGPSARAAGRGILIVTAPPDAEVFLDGRRIGLGNVRLEVREGPHRIEVRRGPDRVVERFTLAPGETWTYAATPAP